MSEILTGFKCISLSGIGKKFREQWIFRNISLEIFSGEKIAVTGSNGSGKSTFLQLLSGYITPSTGTVSWQSQNKNISNEEVHKYISFASPYLEMIEEFTLGENLRFYTRFKPLKNGMTPGDLMALAGLDGAMEKQVRNFSSGMKQRLKLALAFNADTPLLLLDEPLTNLDDSGKEWYHKLVTSLDAGRTVIICSNQVKEETWFCDRRLHIEDYK